MNINLENLILALAMSIDAMIVSFSYGLIIKISRLKNSLKFGISFGLFQFIMPIFGWLVVSIIYSMLEVYAKWIEFSIFLILALKFLQDVVINKKEESIKCISLICLLALSVATSIDAFFAGTVIKLGGQKSIIFPAALIGIMTFINSIIGFWISSIFKRIPSKYIEITGALLLLYLAFKSIC